MPQVVKIQADISENNSSIDTCVTCPSVPSRHPTQPWPTYMLLPRGVRGDWRHMVPDPASAGLGRSGGVRPDIRASVGAQ
jgi:hypothetical protein